MAKKVTPAAADPQPSVGHNQPPEGLSDLYDFSYLPDQLAERFADLQERQVKLVEAIDRWTAQMTKTPHDAQEEVIKGRDVTPMTKIEIGTPDAYQRSIDFGRQLRDTRKDWDATRMKTKEPFRKAGEAVDAFFKTLVESLAAGERTIRDAVDDYARAAAAREREAQLARAAEERRAAEAIAKAAEETGSEDAMQQAMVMEDQAERRAAAALAPSGGREAAAVRTSLGTSANLAGKYTFEIIDADKVPRPLCLPDRRLIQTRIDTEKKMRTGRIPADLIEGVRIDYTENVRLR